MTTMTEQDQSLEFISRMVNEEVSHLIREDPDTKGVVQIEVGQNGSYDIILHKGDEAEPTTIEDVGKEKLMEMLDKQL